jgi:hypothetical protein
VIIHKRREPNLATGQRENLIKKTFMFWWQHLETCNVNMAISQIFPSKGSDFGHIIFHKKKKKNPGANDAFIKTGAFSFFEDRGSRMPLCPLRTARPLRCQIHAGLFPRFDSWILLLLGRP